MHGQRGGTAWRTLLIVDGGTATEPRGRVLIADDDDGLRETMKLWLTDDAWDVLEATNGQEALEQLDDSVDILILDRRMPELSGPEVVDRLDRTAFQGTVVVVSAYEPDEHLTEEEVSDYITKPIDRDQFVRHLQRSVR